MAVDPIITNESGTVGLCSGYIPKSDFVGKFRPSILKEWIESLLSNCGDEQIYLYAHASSNPDVSGTMLAASMEHGNFDEIYICVVGCDNEDVLEKTVVKTANKTIEKKTKIKDVKKT